MPFNVGPIELIIVLIIALLVIGPRRLPEMGNAVGKTIREFRKASSEIGEATTLEPAPKPTTDVAAPAPSPSPATTEAQAQAAPPAPEPAPAPPAPEPAPAPSESVGEASSTRPGSDDGPG